MTIEPATSQEIDALALARRERWPVELRLLIERYPREVWHAHANLGEMARFWLARHDMFRELAASIEAGAARFREGQVAASEFGRWFAPRLQFFLEQLHVHHHIEDGHYFPVLRAAEEKLARGFDVLENDHVAIHGDIARTVENANALLRALGGSADAQQRAGAGYAAAGAALLKSLRRHLDDEEDLIVPLILDRGEEKLGVAHG
jgi:hemerythrin-like domain-containing protein